ncbi:MAG: PA14 domain-containing protein, partial [Bacteroidota bacterium]
LEYIEYQDFSGTVLPSTPSLPYRNCTNEDFFISTRTYCVFVEGSKYEIQENTTYSNGIATAISNTNLTTGESPYEIPILAVETNCGTPQYTWKCLYERAKKSPCSVQGDEKLNYEVWEGQRGSTLSNANYTIPATFNYTINSAEAPINQLDNISSRITGWIKAPVSGTYIIAISSDDQSELRISNDDNPANLSTAPIVSVPGWTPSRSWNRYREQQAKVELEACKWYYIEAIHKEGRGGDNLAIGWVVPGASSIAVIRSGISSILPSQAQAVECVEVRERTTQYEGAMPVVDYFVMNKNNELVSHEIQGAISSCNCCVSNGTLSVEKKWITTDWISGHILPDGTTNSTSNVRQFTSTLTGTNANTWELEIRWNDSHPKGSSYAIQLTSEEDRKNRDARKAWVVENTRTPLGFNVRVTIDDNGNAADIGVLEDIFVTVAGDEREYVENVTLSP